MSKNIGVNASVYKNLPHDWEVLTLEEITQPNAPIRYGVVQIGEDTPGGVPIVPIKYINQIDTSTLHRASPKIENKYSGSRIKSDDILLSVKATIGDVGIVPQGFEGNIAREIARIRLSEKYDPKFIALQLQSDNTQRRIDKLTVGSTRREFSIHAVRKFPIAIPKSKNEQQHISSIIEKWDKAIAVTENLITAKQHQFEWLTSRLINQNDNWNASPLCKLAKVKKGKQLNRNELEDQGEYPAWNGGITPSGYTDAWNTPENTVTISEGGNSCGFVNYAREKFWCGGHCYAIIDLSKKIDAEFLYHFLKANQKRIMRLRVGSGLPNIQKKDVDKFEIRYPDITEQKSIAHTFNIAQKEITLLQELAAQYRTQKRGLMQKLLSGQWRLTDKKEAA